MADVHTKTTRSFNMSQIKHRDTKPEIIVRKLCHELGLRFRLNQKIAGTRPDLVFKKHRTVIFVHGCFWHKHNCMYGNIVPKTNSEFWEAKRNATVLRDQNNYAEINLMGWKYVVLWECNLSNLDGVNRELLEVFHISNSS